MLYSEIIAVCSQSHTIHINTLCAEDAERYTRLVALRCKWLVTLQFPSPVTAPNTTPLSQKEPARSRKYPVGTRA